MPPALVAKRPGAVNVDRTPSASRNDASATLRFFALGQIVDERLDDVRVEQALGGVLAEDRHAALSRERLLVGARRRERIVDVGEADDPRLDRDILAGE